MKIKLLPLVALISATPLVAYAGEQANDAYVTDTYGNIVVDSYGACTRSINWTPETALARCENPESTATTPAPTVKDTTAAGVAAASTSSKVADDAIKDNGLRGYAIDSDGYVVRDSWGACVRTIEWTPETEIARCEGKEEVVVVEEVVVEPVITPPPAPVIAPVVAPVVEQPKPAPKPVPTITHLREFFDTNSAKLKPSAYAELDEFAEFLIAHPEQKITITGHTDSRGEASYNQKLSEKRANAVKEYFINKGISADRMKTYGAGETQPIADNRTRDGRAQNRRVEVELVQ